MRRVAIWAPVGGFVGAEAGAFRDAALGDPLGGEPFDVVLEDRPVVVVEGEIGVMDAPHERVIGVGGAAGGAGGDRQLAVDEGALRG